MLPVNPQVIGDDNSIEDFELKNADEEYPLTIGENTVKRTCANRCCMTTSLFFLAVSGLLGIVLIAAVAHGSGIKWSNVLWREAKLKIEYANSIETNVHSRTDSNDMTSLVLKQDPIANHTLVTIVTMGYSPSRIKNYAEMLLKYRSMCGIVSSVIIVWNNPDVDPPAIPPAEQGAKCEIPVLLTRSERNSLNNRFSVADLVTTEVVLSIDDDLVIYPSLLQCMAQHWEQNRNRIVGVHPRYINADGEYTSPKNPYNVILSSLALINTQYLRMYSKDEKIQEFVDSNMDGEDILMNAIVQNKTHTPPLFVHATSNVGYKDFKKSSETGLSSRTNWADWTAGRSEISKWAQQYFGSDVFHSTSETAYCGNCSTSTILFIIVSQILLL